MIKNHKPNLIKFGQGQPTLVTTNVLFQIDIISFLQLSQLF